MHTITARLKNLFLSSWHPFLWFFLVGFLVYGQALFFGFSYFDDNILILERIHQLRDISSLGNVFQNDVFHLAHHPGSYYRPLLVLSFMVDALVAGANPLIFHFSNILIHVLSVCILFVLLQELFPFCGKVFCFSLLFLVHPANVQAVVWLPGRNDLLLAFFAMTSFLFFIKDLQHPCLRKSLGHFVLFFLALMTKESAVALPVLCFCYFVFVQKGRIAQFPVKFYLGWVLCLGLWFLCRSAALKTMGLGMAVSFGSVLQNSPAIILYLGKVFFPFNLSVFPILRDSSLWWGILAIFMMSVVVSCFQGKRRPMIVFGFLWFLFFIAFALLRVTSPEAPADFLEHRLYVPMVGILLVLLGTQNNPLGRYGPRLTILIFVSSFLAFSLINISYARNFQDRLTFWQRAVKDAPGAALVHANLGAMYYFDKKFEPAIYEYQQALALNPRQDMVHSNLALIFEKQDRFLEAEQEFLTELSLSPRYADGYFNLGLLRYRQRRIDEARQLMRQTISLDPYHVGAHQALAVDFYHSGDKENLSLYLQKLKEMNLAISSDFLQKVNLW